MPTPVQHLVVANAILTDPRLSDRARAVLTGQRSAFLLGNTAPDVQTVSGQPREATHFFNVPLDTDRPAHEVMFDAHPQLSRLDQMTATHAAFMAGYVTHLLLDVSWVRDIFTPIFGPHAGWGHFRDRLFLHNVLRAWCDRHDQTRIAADAGRLLASAVPDRWLPFTADLYLCRWRDELVDQFAPGATIKTVEVFAERGRVPPEAFERILGSPDQMGRLIFSHVSRDAIDDFYTRGLDHSCALISNYLSTGGIADAGR